jgi:hypothetical protein
MGGRSDAIVLSDSRLCRVADVPRPTRGRWAKDGLLRERDDNKYGAVDLFELIALKALMAALGPSDARLAWRQVRAQFTSHLLAGAVDVVFSESDNEAILATDDGQVAGAVRHGRPVRVVSLTAELERARRALDLIRTYGDEATRPAAGSRRSGRGQRSTQQT